MDTYPISPLVGPLFLLLICCNIILPSALTQFDAYAKQCVDKLIDGSSNWSEGSEDWSGPSLVNDENEVEIVWYVANDYTASCPYQESGEDMDDEEANLSGLKCSHHCRFNSFAVTGKCNEQGKCECCGEGGNFCNRENGIWSESISYDGSSCNDVDCDLSCDAFEDSAFGACFDGSCQCCSPH